MGNAIQHPVKAIFQHGYLEIELHWSKSSVIIIFHPYTSPHGKNIFSCFGEHFPVYFIPNKSNILNQFSTSFPGDYPNFIS